MFRRQDYCRGPPAHALMHWDNGRELRRSFQQSRRYRQCWQSSLSVGWPAAAVVDGRRSATWIGEASGLAGALRRSPSFGILSTVTWGDIRHTGADQAVQNWYFLTDAERRWCVGDLPLVRWLKRSSGGALTLVSKYLYPFYLTEKSIESFPPSFSSLVRAFASRLHCSESF